MAVAVKHALNDTLEVAKIVGAMLRRYASEYRWQTNVAHHIIQHAADLLCEMLLLLLYCYRNTVERE